MVGIKHVCLLILIDKGVSEVYFSSIFLYLPFFKVTHLLAFIAGPSPLFLLVKVH